MRIRFECVAEESSLRAWPALEEVAYDGWLVRFANGYTKRTNSVTVLNPGDGDFGGKIDACERLYRERGFRSVFRLLSFTAPEALDQALMARGYEMVEPSHVLHLPASEYRGTAKNTRDIVNAKRDEWLDLHARLVGRDEAQKEAHLAILSAIRGKTEYALASDTRQSVGCGLGVLDREFFWLFDLATSPQHRNRGYGTALVDYLLHWAINLGAEHACLQVVVGNEPAVNLYTNLGYRELYRYWYRVAPELGGGHTTGE
ncbi:MAG: GNAT family N-acetyltransferase [Chloroflexi bacterium]|nr:GNAT family N-acetyltransferase [Chloroflexota bacterium]